MCGIAGYLSEREWPPDVLARMTSRLVHRGPDAEGYHRDGPIALGHRRLSILDIEGSPQPMSSPDGELTVVFNGEIYNFAALRSSLAARGHTFRTRGDTEVLLHAYREYGRDMLDYLQGMFAFALWDKRQGRLFLARDQLGVKPLHYSWNGTTFVFGSELKAVIEHPAVSREIDVDAVGLYLESQYIPAPRSIYRHVRKLEAGHALIFEKGEIKEWRYWLPDYSEKMRFGESEAVKRLEAELRQSVESMLIADVPLGSFLSGGVDSSLVSALMVDISGRSMDTFTLGFEGENASSEHTHAEAVARHIRSTHHVLMLRPGDLLPALEHWAEFFDEPFADPAALPTMLLAQLTRKHVTVALTGEGADEVFSGYGDYLRRVREERFTRILGSAYSPLRYLVRYLPPAVRKSRFVKAIGEPLGRRFTTTARVFDSAILAAASTPRFLAVQRARMADHAERFFAECNSRHYIDRLMYVDARLWLVDDLLTKVDRATMAHSLEARVPYLDHRFFEFCARLDPSLKQHGRTGKYLLKKVAEKYLPGTIVHRKKSGFVPPLGDWFAGPLREETTIALSRQRLGARGLLRADKLQQLLHQHYEKGVNHRSRLWALLMLERWFQRYAPDFAL